MLMEKMNWMQVEEYLKKDDRLVLVAGSIEEHGYNSVATDTVCAYEIAKVACEKTNVVLAPPIYYSFAGWVTSFPGTVSIKPTTFMLLVEDVLRSLTTQGFRRILFLSGHGENDTAKAVISQLSVENPNLNVKFRMWQQMPKTQATIRENGGNYFDHASWMESFPWINQTVEMPQKVKPTLNLEDWPTLGPMRSREIMPDGVGGGVYSKDEEFMRKYFEIVVNEVVGVLDGDWAKNPQVLK